MVIWRFSILLNNTSFFEKLKQSKKNRRVYGYKKSRRQNFSIVFFISGDIATVEYSWNILYEWRHPTASEQSTVGNCR